MWVNEKVVSSHSRYSCNPAGDSESAGHPQRFPGQTPGSRPCPDKSAEPLPQLGLGGSYSYGTDIPGSDIDIRGVTLNRKSDLIGLTGYEQYVDKNTDTVIASAEILHGILYGIVDMPLLLFLRIGIPGKRILKPAQLGVRVSAKRTDGPSGQEHLPVVQKALPNVIQVQVMF